MGPRGYRAGHSPTTGRKVRSDLPTRWELPLLPKDDAPRMTRGCPGTRPE